MSEDLPYLNKLMQASKNHISPKINVSQYNNGYQQISKRTLNHLVRSWDLQWTPLSKAQLVILEQFYDDNGTWNVWQWTAPDDDENRLWRFTSDFTKTNVADYYRINLTCEECF